MNAPLLHESAESPTRLVIAQVLKQLYPQNPDVVLGREARAIADALREVGLVDADVERVTYREWQVITTDHEGIAFTAEDSRHDGRLSAEQWLARLGSGYELVLAEYEYWVSPTRLVSREVAS